jgi:hypothetical protein
MCDLLSGNIDKKCKTTNGGNAELYLFNSVENPFTIVDGVATAIDAGLTVVYKYNIKGGDGNTLSTPLVTDQVTKTSLCTSTMVAQLWGADAATGFELTKAAQGDTMAVLVSRNGVATVLGHQEGFKTFTAEETSGGAMADFNGYNVTTVSETTALPPKLDAATLTAFKALYVPTP